MPQFRQRSDSGEKESSFLGEHILSAVLLLSIIYKEHSYLLYLAFFFDELIICQRESESDIFYEGSYVLQLCLRFLLTNEDIESESKKAAVFAFTIFIKE